MLIFIGIGLDNDNISLFAEIFTCKRGRLPMKYLEIHVDENRLKISDWNPTVGKMEKKTSCWLGRFLNIAGRTSLVNSSLSSLILYMISFYGLPKGFKKKVDRPSGYGQRLTKKVMASFFVGQVCSWNYSLLGTT